MSSRDHSQRMISLRVPVPHEYVGVDLVRHVYLSEDGSEIISREPAYILVGSSAMRPSLRLSSKQAHELGQALIYAASLFDREREALVGRVAPDDEDGGLAGGNDKEVP